MDKTTAALAKTLALALGAVLAWLMVQMSLDRSLGQYLNYALFGNIMLTAGAALAVMVALRAYAMFFRKEEACCGHDHGDEGHDHAHGVSLWRLMVLVAPVTLLAMGWAPNELSADALRKRMSQDQVLAINIQLPGLSPARQEAAKKAKIDDASTKTLFDDAKHADLRERWESLEKPRAVRLTGRFFPAAGNAGRYQLMKPKMTCCAQDATPVVVVVIGKAPAPWRDGDWVRIEGIVTFREDSTDHTFIPVVYAVQQEKLDAAPPAIYD